MILFFDTETTGLPQDRYPIDHPDQPHIVQLAAQLCADDGKALAGFALIVDPGIASGVRIPARAAEVHGITDEIAAKLGVPLEFAINAFSHLYQRADLVCAHNIKFDVFVTETAIARHHKQIRKLQKPMFCTMEAASPIVNLPPTDRMKAAGFTKPKPPKLEEAYKHFLNEELKGAHDAMVDVAACARLYFHLKSLKEVA